MRSRTDLVRRGAAVTLAALAISAFSSTAGAGAQDGVVHGAATATADSVLIEMSSSGVALGFAVGRSTAHYKDVVADSEGRAIDLGLLQTVLGVPQCGGDEPPVLNLATLPPKTVADSSVPGADVPRPTEVRAPAGGTDPAGPVVGVQDATATPTPSSWASTKSEDGDFLLIAVKGATTETETRFEGGVRYAHAVSSAEELRVLGGLLTFDKPRWEATARSGARSEQEATFTFTSATLLGMPRTHDQAMADLKGLKQGIEQLLSGLGVKFRLPEVEHTTDNMGITISPMGFVIDKPPIGRDLIFPWLNSDLVKQEQADDIAADCRNELKWTVISTLRGVFGGTGQVRVLVGGATAGTDESDYSVQPFGEFEAAPPEEPAPAPTTVDTVDTTPAPTAPADFSTGDFTDGTYSAITDDYSGSTFDTGSVDDFATDDTVALEEFATSEEASAPVKSTEKIAAAKAKEPAASTSAVAVIVGVLALLGALALSMGDRILGRRHRRIIP